MATEGITRHVAPRVITNILCGRPEISNKRAIEKNIGRLAPSTSSLPKSGWKKLDKSLINVMAEPASKRRTESEALKNLDIEENRKNLEKSLGISVAYSKHASRYNRDSGVLELSPKGMAAAAMMEQHFGGLVERSSDMIASVLDDGKPPARRYSAQDAAAALFFLHIAANGIDGALGNLSISPKAAGFLIKNRMSFGQQFGDELRGIQKEYVLMIYVGEKRNAA